MKTVLKITTNEWINFSRDKRELSVVKGLGAKVIVMAKGKTNNTIDYVDGFPVHRYSTRPFGNKKGLLYLNRIFSVFIWACYARKFKPDVISGHDIDALAIGYLSSLFLLKRDKPKLVYDSHEFELGRKKRSKLQLFFISILERYLMKRCSISIMVNETIANEVKRIHKLKKRPIVVRNIPNKWTLDQELILKRRNEVCNALKVSTETTILMYHGALFPYRGIENMLKAMSKTENTVCFILGNGKNDYKESLIKLCDKLHVKDRAYFHDAVPIEELYQYVACADIGFVILEPVVKNHYFTLPNKFFENIQSLCPVIVSDFPETGKLTKKFGIGMVVNPTNIKEITDAINKLCQDQAYYQSCKINLKKAKEELCWENEKKVLINAYTKIL